MSVKTARDTVEIMRNVELRNLSNRGDFGVVFLIDTIHNILHPVEGLFLR